MCLSYWPLAVPQHRTPRVRSWSHDWSRHSKTWNWPGPCSFVQYSLDKCGLVDWPRDSSMRRAGRVPRFSDRIRSPRLRHQAHESPLCFVQQSWSWTSPMGVTTTSVPDSSCWSSIQPPVGSIYQSFGLDADRHYEGERRCVSEPSS